MFDRNTLHSFLTSLAATILLTVGLACSEKTAEENTATSADSSAITPDSVAAPGTEDSAELLTDLSDVVLPPDSPEEFERKKQEIYSWTPQQPSRVEYPLRGVTKIVMWEDLGLGDQIEVILPQQGAGGWPVGHSVRLKLDDDLTTVAMRFIIDTLPGPRVRGEGFLGLFAVHCDTLYGKDIELPRTQTGTGRLDILYLFEQVMAQTNCCDIPPTFRLGSFGNLGDTLTLMITFDKTTTKYLTTIIGPHNGRSYPGRNYCRFRTERGEYHKDQKDYPYTYECSDPGYVNLFIGSRWRGRKTCLEPVLRARMF